MTNPANFDREGLLMLLETFLLEMRREYFTLRIASAQLDDEKTQKAWQNCRKFIASKYFEKLTSLDGKAVLQELDRQDAVNGLMEASQKRMMLEKQRDVDLRRSARQLEVLSR